MVGSSVTGRLSFGVCGDGRPEFFVNQDYGLTKTLTPDNCHLRQDGENVSQSLSAGFPWCFIGDRTGTFQNLDFESAFLTDIPAGQSGGFVSIDEAFPGWTGYIGTNQVTQVRQNSLTLGEPSIDILGPSWIGISGIAANGIISGRYTVLLQAGTYPDRPPANAAIAQVGQVPIYARSIQLKESGIQFVLSLAGQTIPLIPIGSGSNYTLYSGDISQFAGQTVELRLTAEGNPDSYFPWDFVDDIKFSSSVIPEPKIIALLAIGAVMGRRVFNRGRLHSPWRLTLL